MEFNEEYELVLNFITTSEYLLRDEKRYAEYTLNASMWSLRNRKFLFEDQILARHKSCRSIEEVLKERYMQYIPGVMMQRGDKKEMTYYDIWSTDIIEPADSFFSFFFVCKLSNLDFLHIDDFLQYQLENNFDENPQKYLRFLELIFRRYDYLLNVKSLDTAKEWMAFLQKRNELAGIPTEIQNKKVKVKREIGDNITSLNLAQTAYLINLLKQARIIIKDDTLLTSKTAGEAFSLLTGFSPDTLRLKMNLKGQKELTYQDRVKVRKILTELLTYVDQELNGEKRRNP